MRKTDNLEIGFGDMISATRRYITKMCAMIQKASITKYLALFISVLGSVMNLTLIAIKYVPPNVIDAVKSMNIVWIMISFMLISIVPYFIVDWCLSYTHNAANQQHMEQSAAARNVSAEFAWLSCAFKVTP